MNDCLRRLADKHNALLARVFHPDYSVLQPGDREKLYPTEKRLEEMRFTRA